MPRFALVICAVLAINCGDNRYSDVCRNACPAAPNAACDDATTLVEYSDGTCDEDTAACSYTETRTNCATTFQVCASGKCVAPDDPCAGTQCTAAPAATCAGTVLNAFDPNGACDSATGDCSYTPRTIDCAITHQICDNGACVDPCGGFTCDTPPGATCTGTMSTTYGATGVCSSSSGTPTCHYTATTVNCATGNGACNSATGLCTSPCTGVSCVTPPAPSCVGAISITYAAAGTCDGTSGTATCNYSVTNTNCASTGQTCDIPTGLCVTADPCIGVSCTTPPSASCSGSVSTVPDVTGACVVNAGIAECHYGASIVDCATTGESCDGATGHCVDVCQAVTCATPPPPQCSGTTSISFGAAGTCSGTSGSPVCSYPQTPTDCTATDQTCDPATGLCADPCTLTSCTTPPAATCAANQLTTYGAGTCGSTGGVPTCSYAPTTIDCGAGFCDANSAACLADCGGSTCQTPPAATCSSDNLLTTYVAPGTCDTSGAPTCVFAPATTDCSATGQICLAGACGGAVQVRTQSPATITDVAGTSQSVTGRILITGVTDLTAGNDALDFLDLVELGVGTGTDPTTYTYQVAVPNAAYAGDEPGWDEYTATFTVAGTAGSVQHYAYRLTRNGGATWIYGDLGTGSSDGFTTPGTLNIARPFFSEYVEGGGNNKAVEIYNPGSVPFSLSGCVIRQWTNAGTSPTTVLTFAATDTIAANNVVTFCQTAITGVTCTKTTTSTGLWNGNDTVELFCGGAILDAIGKESENPAFWGTEPTTTINHTLLRHCDVIAGDPIATDAFDPAVQWKTYPQDTFTDLGLRTCPLP